MYNVKHAYANTCDLSLTLSFPLFQISIRTYVSGLRTDLPTLKRLVESWNCSNVMGLVFDTKVYGKTQKLAMILCKKGQAPKHRNKGAEHAKGSDDRILLPVDYEQWEDKGNVQRLSNYVVQVVREKDPSLVLLDTVGEEGPSSSGLRTVRHVQRRNVETNLWETVDAETGEVITPGSDAPLVIGDSNKRMRMTLGLNRAFDVLRPILHQHGFLNPRIVPGTEDMKDQHFTCSFDCDNHLDCPICGHDHENHHYYFNARPGGVNVGNFSDRCKSVNVFSTFFLHEYAPLLEHSINESQLMYANIYKKYRNGVILYDTDKKKFLMFTGANWKEVPKETIYADMTTYFGDQLLNVWMEKLDTWVEKASILRMSDLCEHFKKLKDSYAHRLKTIGQNSYMEGIVKVFSCRVAVTTDIFDKNDHLLHFEDCVLDLHTMTTRPTRPMDYNTVTVGFDYYIDMEDEAMHKSHDRIIRTLYTNQMIRDTAQMVFGLSLSGMPVKLFFVHTDGGGEKAGNNGKTLILDLHHATMGGYACKPRPQMFLKDMKSDANSCTTSLVALAGKRVGHAEELEASRQLNEAEIKNWTNGTNAQVTGRALYREQQSIRLTCKFHVGANNNKFPRCDAIGDQALKDRLFIIPYMSKFLCVPHDKPLENIFVRDTSLSNKLPDLRWYHMQWLIEGYKKYMANPTALEYDNLPSFMQQFKEDVLVQQSPVYGILLDLITKAEDLDIQSNVQKHKGLDMEAVWSRVKEDKRFRGFMDRAMVEQAFKSICKGDKDCQGCIRFCKNRGVYSTHHKLRQSENLHHDVTQNMGAAYL